MTKEPVWPAILIMCTALISWTKCICYIIVLPNLVSTSYTIREQTVWYLLIFCIMFLTAVTFERDYFREEALKHQER